MSLSGFLRPAAGLGGFVKDHGVNLFITAVILAIIAHVCLTISVQLLRQTAPELAGSDAGFLLLRGWEAAKITALTMLACFYRSGPAHPLGRAGVSCLAALGLIWTGLALEHTDITLWQWTGVPAGITLSVVVWQITNRSRLSPSAIGVSFIALLMLTQLHHWAHIGSLETLRFMTVPAGANWSYAYTAALMIYTPFSYGLALIWLILKVLTAAYVILSETAPAKASGVSTS